MDRSSIVGQPRVSIKNKNKAKVDNGGVSKLVEGITMTAEPNIRFMGGADEEEIQLKLGLSSDDSDDIFNVIPPRLSRPYTA